MAPPHTDKADAAQAALPSLTDTAATLATTAGAIAQNLLRLLALESQRAALSLSTMVCLGVVAALLISSAWLLLLAAAAIWLVRLGLSWELALLAAAVLNISLSAAVFSLIRHLSQHLRFRATRRQLGLGDGEPKHA
ncbi:MAG: hypothetical protein R3F53_27550 [Gammaproteobacteria bacterium]